MRKTHLLLSLICGVTLALTACAASAPYEPDNVLKTDDFISIALSHREGSGQGRSLTLSYTENDTRKSAMPETFLFLYGLDSEQFDPEFPGAQLITDSDGNGDGIADITVYTWCSFSDLPSVKWLLWPEVYEYDLTKGFIKVSERYKEYFDRYANEGLAYLKEHGVEQSGTTFHCTRHLGSPDMPVTKLFYRNPFESEYSLLAQCRLIYAAQGMAGGTFAEKGLHESDDHYENMLEYTKDVRVTGWQ